MNPPTLSNAAIATLVVTKVFDKLEKNLVAENFPEQCSKLMQILQSEFPNTALNIKHLEEEQPDFNKILRVSLELEEAAKSNSEVAEAVQSVVDVVNKQPSHYGFFTKSLMYTAYLEYMKR
jgi:hypothetical protein